MSHLESRLLSLSAGRIVGGVHPLVRTLRAWLQGSPMPALPEGIHVLAARHRLAGTLYHIGAPLSDFDTRHCEAAWNRNLAGHLARGAALAACWPPDAPPPLVFKGADLGEQIYGDPGARHASDLDVLVPAPQFERVTRSLEARAGSGEPASYERFPGEPSYVLGFRIDGLLLEVHQAPQPLHRARLTADALWARALPGRLGDLPVRYPAPEDRVLLWLTNQAKGAFHGGLGGLLDFALLLRALPGGFETARRAARGVGLGRPWQLALVRLRESGIWPHALPAVRDPRVHAIARLLPPVLAPSLYSNDATFQLVKLWLCDGRGRVGTLLRAVVSRRG